MRYTPITLAHDGQKAIGYGGPVLREIAGSGFFFAPRPHTVLRQDTRARLAPADAPAVKAAAYLAK